MKLQGFPGLGPIRALAETGPQLSLSILDNEALRGTDWESVPERPRRGRFRGHSEQ